MKMERGAVDLALGALRLSRSASSFHGLRIIQPGPIARWIKARRVCHRLPSDLTRKDIDVVSVPSAG